MAAAVLSKNGGSLLLRMMSERPGNRIERAYRHLLAETKKLLPSQDWCCTSVYIESRGDRGKWEEWLARTDR
ncbi:hypothetical protein [Paenibacillus sp. Root444D2]|uniref:hypothetical protein n=1 Tax=Paenibacillus sp. Root444D2 TaxID=1736538 RepID=UPI00070E38D0|nr:hypothetical protein [Paenibacillus sp. Root444D2]KQX52382.1 hypothetical protein ASD40_34895 [Paenibacillus sp. Root444D2]